MPPILPKKAKSEEHGTPQHMFDEWDEEFSFTLDAAASDLNHKCPKYYTKETNGLAHSWAGETVWCNPPYNKEALTDFTNKAIEEMWLHDVTSVFLVPCKTDQGWWHRLWKMFLDGENVEFRWIKGRIKFEGNTHSAAFPCVLIVVRPK